MNNCQRFMIYYRRQGSSPSPQKIKAKKQNGCLKRPLAVIHDILQETGIKPIPPKKKGKKAKWLSEEALQIAVKRREGKSKGEKERYTYLNEESQRISRKDKKALFSNQCKEREANNRIGKTKDFFKKIIETKGTFVPKDEHNEGHKWYGTNRSRRY